MNIDLVNITLEQFGLVAVALMLIAVCFMLIRAMIKSDTIVSDGDEIDFIEDETSEFFFIYASNANRYPFSAGWTRVIAKDREAADAAFRIYHPDFFPDLMSCAAVYEGDTFRETSIYKTGNYGEYEHETISVSHVVVLRKGDKK